jgi:hypothetical protein
MTREKNPDAAIKPIIAGMNMVVEHRNIHIPLMTKLSIPPRWPHPHFCAGFWQLKQAGGKSRR